MEISSKVNLPKDSKDYTLSSLEDLPIFLTSFINLLNDVLHCHF